MMKASEVLDIVRSYRLIKDGVLKANIEPGSERVIFIAGSNATGKSLLVQMLSSTLNEMDLTPFQVSMKYRTKGGLHRAFMFGPYGDDEESTGLLSIKVTQKGMYSAENADKPCALLLDEPDIGLSDGYAAAMGELIGTWSVKQPANSPCKFLVVVSHSQKLLAGVEKAIGEKATWIVLGGQSRQEWLSEPDRSVDELVDLAEGAKKIRNGIADMVKKRKAKS